MGRDAAGSEGMHGPAGAVTRTLVDSFSERPASRPLLCVTVHLVWFVHPLFAREQPALTSCTRWTWAVMPLLSSHTSMA